jgi:DNA-binding transcriptional ArsR family regulator
VSKKVTLRRELKAASRIMAAFSEPNRRAMMERLIVRPRSVNEIAEGLPISRPAVSQHLKILSAAELVVQTKAGNRRIYSANPAVLGELRAYVDALWEASLKTYASSITKRRTGRSG